MINETTTPLEALKLAREREIETYIMYKKAAEVVTDQSARKMFQFLAEEELKHQKLIEDELNTHYAQDF